MNKGYTQANKRKDMAAKMPMGLTMNGKDSGYGGGMKYQGNGKNSGKGGGMKVDMHGKNSGKSGGMNYPLSNKNASFSRNYTQNGKGKE